MTKPIVWLWSIVVAVTTLAGLLIFRPSVAVDPQELLNPSNAFTALIEITNNSAFAIHNTTVECLLGSAAVGGIVVLRNNRFVGRDFIRVIDPEESVTVHCPVLGKPGETPTSVVGTELPLQSADLTIIVGFRPSFWPVRTRINRRFVTAANSDGTLRWIRRQVAE
jgi:hypothetical protein